MIANPIAPRTALLAAACVLFSAACRETVDAFSPVDRPPVATEPLRLTYSHDDDRSPAWSPASDSVYYATSRWPGVPEADGVLMSIARDGGIAAPHYAGQHGVPAPASLVEPQPLPDGVALSFVELAPLHPERVCETTFIECGLAGPAASVRLGEAWLRAAPAATAPVSTIVTPLRFEGGAVRLVEPLAGLTGFETRYHPFQARWLSERALPFKPSWSPAGDAVATSDGLGILVVDAAGGGADTIVVGDAANPAWSPDGAWIAFDRVERVDSVVDLCVLWDWDPKGDSVRVNHCAERRVYYETTPPAVHLVRPDGSDAHPVAAGSDPTWSPDGRFIYYVGASSLRRLEVDTGADVALAGTERGREPAVSPDGRWLAFTRYDPVHDGNDVWVAELP